MKISKILIPNSKNEIVLSEKDLDAILTEGEAFIKKFNCKTIKDCKKKIKKLVITPKTGLVVFKSAEYNLYYIRELMEEFMKKTQEGYILVTTLIEEREDIEMRLLIIEKEV